MARPTNPKSTHKSARGKADRRPTEVEVELLALAAHLEQIARGARNLVESDDARRHAEREGLDKRLGYERDRLLRMVRASSDVEDGDAWFMFTSWILAAARIPGAPTARLDDETVQHRARVVLEKVAADFPAFADAMRDKGRLDLTAAARRSIAASPRRVPWKPIFEAWTGSQDGKVRVGRGLAPPVQDVKAWSRKYTERLDPMKRR